MDSIYQGHHRYFFIISDFTWQMLSAARQNLTRHSPNVPEVPDEVK